MELTRREFLRKAAGLGVLGASSLALSKNFLSLDLEKEKPDLEEARYWEKGKGEKVKCKLCPKKCEIEGGKRGLCRARKNLNGKLYTLAYGNPCAIHVNPIEKKPLFHVLPATRAFSIATAGCCLGCIFCQNWTISQNSPTETNNIPLPPKEVIKQAKKRNCSSVAYTYTEPTIFYEYMYDTAKIAKREDLLNLWITCGFINDKPLNELSKVIDAANVDLKGNKEYYKNVCHAELEPVLNSLKTLKSKGVWFEITHLIVPTLNDDMGEFRELVKWIYDNLGPNYPLHISRFYPAYRLRNLPPTPFKTLKKAYGIAKEEGLNYVYIGNLKPEERGKYQNTYCHNCGKLVIERKGYLAKSYLEDGECPYCGTEIPGIF